MNERKGPLRVAFAAALLRTTECLGDHWDGVTNSAVRFVTLPQLELSRMCCRSQSCRVSGQA